MIIAKLKKFASDGETVQCWEMEVEGNKYRTHVSQEGGKVTTSKWTVIDKGKNIGKANETSPEQQALKEAQAKVQKKKDSGYGEEALHLDFIKPMAAWPEPDYHDYLLEQFKEGKPVVIQPKLDGLRMIATRNGCFTKNGNPIPAAQFIAARLAPFFAKHPTVFIDGELFILRGEASFETLMGIARTQKLEDEDLEKAKSLQYWVYDCGDHPTLIQDNDALQITPAPYSERMSWLKENLKFSGNLVLVETHKIVSANEMNVKYREFLDKKFEGAIVRMADAPYVFTRTKDMLKLKPWLTDEFEVLDSIQGIGNRSGTVGKLVLRNKDGEKFESDIIGDRAYITKLWHDRDMLVGKIVTVKYNELTSRGVPRFGKVIAIRDYE